MGVLPIAPQVLTNDANVSYYMKHKHRKRFPICVSLIEKQIIAPPPNECREVDKGKAVAVELSRNEPKKRRNHVIFNNQQLDPIINNEHTKQSIEVYNRDEDEVYRRDRDDYHNDDREDEECFDGVDENNDGVDEHNNEENRDEEFEEFANREEYDEFVNNFTVPSGHCQPCGPTNIRLPTECVVPPMKCVPYSWKAPEFTRDDVVKDVPTQNSSQSYTGSSEEVYVGLQFESKEELKKHMYVFSLKNNFEFRVKASSKSRWYLLCKDETCTWRLRAIVQWNASWVITVYESKHSCARLVRTEGHVGAKPWVLGHVFKEKYGINSLDDYSAHNLREEVKTRWGVNVSYLKAWRSREEAIGYVRGTPQQSYKKLPSWLYMLKKNNPGTLTDFVRDGNKFKYAFFAIGACLRGFKSCRPVIAVDGAFLKTKFGGELLVAIASDANTQLYPLAFGVVDCECHASWIWFLRKLREAIGEDVPNLAFISDRHVSIEHGLNVVFPGVPHGACYHHLKLNVTHKFKTDHCEHEMYGAAYAFSERAFHAHFRQLRQKDVEMAKYLEEVGIDRWARAFFPSKRYKSTPLAVYIKVVRFSKDKYFGLRYEIMTSNYAESFNSKTRDARTFPITTLLEFIRFTLQNWFFDREEEANTLETKMTPVWHQDFENLTQKAKFVDVYPLGLHECHVKDLTGEYNVDLLANTCSCGLLQQLGIPCEHAIASAQKRSIDVMSLVKDFYFKETWIEMYKEAIYPVGDEDQWDVPDEIKTMTVELPVEKKQAGRPKKISKQGRRRIKRYPSQGEKVTIPHKCSNCGGTRHNRKTCTWRG